MDHSDGHCFILGRIITCRSWPRGCFRYLPGTEHQSDAASLQETALSFKFKYQFENIKTPLPEPITNEEVDEEVDTSAR